MDSTTHTDMDIPSKLITGCPLQPHFPSDCSRSLKEETNHVHARVLEKGIVSVYVTLSKIKVLESTKLLGSLESESKAVSLMLKQFN